MLLEKLKRERKIKTEGEIKNEYPVNPNSTLDNIVHISKRWLDYEPDNDHWKKLRATWETPAM